MNEYDTKYTKNKKRCTTANTSLDIYESLVAGAALRWLDRGARALCLGVLARTCAFITASGGERHYRDPANVDRTRVNRRSDDFQPSADGDRWRLGNFCVATCIGESPGPTGVVVSRKCWCTQGQASYGDHRYLLNPPTKDIYQRITV